MVKYRRKDLLEKNGMQIHIHTREAPNERPHVHVIKKGRPSKNDLKVWLDTLDVEEGRTKFKPAEIKIIKADIRRHKKHLLELWVETHGPIKKRRK